MVPWVSCEGVDEMPIMTGSFEREMMETSRHRGDLPSVGRRDYDGDRGIEETIDLRGMRPFSCALARRSVP